MIGFIEYLAEAKSGEEADRHGKIHELLTGWHLNRLIHGTGAHMSHFRDEHGNTPEEALKKHTNGMTHDELTHHNNKAIQAASAIHDHIKEKHPEILKVDKKKGEHNRVTWTSQSNDIQNLTGKADKAQSAGGADVMVTKHNKTGHVEHNHHAYGASLKYLSKKSKVTQSNRGMGSLETQFGMKKGTLSQHDNDHDERMTKLLGSKSATARHETYKKSRDNEKPSAKDKAIKDAVSKSDTERNQKQAKAIADHLNSMPHHERKHHIANLLAPEHTHPTYQIRTNHDHDKPTHIENSHEVVRKALEGDHHIHHEGRYVHVVQGTKEKPGKRLASIECRSKGRPAGGGSQACPTFSGSMNK